MKTIPTCLCIFGLAGAATAGGGFALMDQIGPDDGAEIDTANILANQIFEAAFSVYDIAAIDDFDNASGAAAMSTAMVVSGWNGYVGIDGISALTTNFYNDYTEAGASLTGYLSETVAGAPTGDPNWTFAGYDLIGMMGLWPINVGTQWVSLIPTNEFGVNGQTGVAISFVGDLNSYQCNPAGGFGFGPYQVVASNCAYRVMGGTGDPCDIPLDPDCPTDVSGPEGVPDGLINVDDILAAIATFGQVGDGTSRPLGDCDPLPSGDCQVTVDDLLAVIATFGGDCLPVGACCFGLDGCTDDVKEADCTGEWLGDGSSCADCRAGACCFLDGSCTEGTPDECATAGGTYAGDGIDCLAADCPQPAPGACCLGATDCLDGLLPQDCSDFGGEFQGNGTDCTTISCGWAGCPAGSTDEGVPCQGDTNDPNGDPNGGLNVDPPSFGSIAVGESICGLMSTYTCIGCADDGTDLTYRDTDWYLFDNADGGEYTLRGGGEMALVIGIVDNDALAFVDFVALEPFSEGEITVTLPAGGSYSVWAGFDFNGGTNPCDTGSNQYSVTLEGQAAPVAACCVLGDCIGDLDPTDCANLGGTYEAGQTCATYSCPNAYVPCSSGLGEDPLDPADSWTAGTSDSGSGFIRAMNVAAPSVSDVTVYGLTLFFNGTGFEQCQDGSAIDLSWTLLDDASGFPGATLASGSAGSQAVVDLTYAGAYPLSRWDMSPGYGGAAAWLQVNSNSGGQGDCWFLWMSSTAADAGASAINDGTAWAAETFSVNYCITP